jgi:hypothetical protein
LHPETRLAVLKETFFPFFPLFSTIYHFIRKVNPGQAKERIFVNFYKGLNAIGGSPGGSSANLL